MGITRDMADMRGKGGGVHNFLINPDMQVAQRGTSIAMAHDGTTSSYLIDRFQFSMGGTHEQLDGTYAQVDEHPLNNGKSLKWTTGTAESSYDADEYFYLAQKIEAKNLQQLQWGLSNAKSVTLSFYVKSSITGTFAVGLYKEDNTARIINKTYVISSASTWEKKTITFPADTAGGGVANDTGIGVYLSWHLAAGSNATGGGSNGDWKTYSGLSDWADGQGTNAVATTASATWQMAQCQLEIGNSASNFQDEGIGTTLRKCQRYFENVNWKGYVLSGNSYTTTQWVLSQVLWKVEKRTVPTLTFPTIGNSSGNVGITDSTANLVTQGSTIRSQTTTTGASLYNNNADGYSGLDDDTVCMLYSYGDTTLKVDAEL